jgi:hypothetical protein
VLNICGTYRNHWTKSLMYHFNWAYSPDWPLILIIWQYSAVVLSAGMYTGRVLVKDRIYPIYKSHIHLKNESPVYVFYSHSGGWSPYWVHSVRCHWMAYCTCPGWLWWWRIWWNEDWQGKPKYSEKTYPSATLSTTNPTWTDPGSNPDRRGGKPATNPLSYGATFPVYATSNISAYLAKRKCINSPLQKQIR